MGIMAETLATKDELAAILKKMDAHPAKKKCRELGLDLITRSVV
jgi:hypothetical protein